MIERKANTYQLYLKDDQRPFMESAAGACRFVYNLAYEQRRDWWLSYKRCVGKHISYTSQAAELPFLKKEADWLKEVPSNPLQQALRDLDRAFQDFFSGKRGYPSPRKRGKNDSFRFPMPLKMKRTGKKTGCIKVPKLGWVQFRGYRDVPGQMRNVTFFSKAGRWFMSVQWQREVAEPVPCIKDPVGIDMGVAVFASMSNGRTIESKNFGKKAAARLRKAHKSVSRKKKGSSNRRKAVQRLAKVNSHIANSRKDFLHKASTTIAKSHGIVVLEDLKTSSMSSSAKGTMEKPGRNVRAKSGLNRSILDQGWSMFKTFLAYKLADRGGHLALVNPVYTSQTCSCCGYRDAANRASQSRFACLACGHEENADINAAKNILRRWDTPLKPVEERALAPL